MTSVINGRQEAGERWPPCVDDAEGYTQEAGAFVIPIIQIQRRDKWNGQAKVCVHHVIAGWQWYLAKSGFAKKVRGGSPGIVPVRAMDNEEDGLKRHNTGTHGAIMQSDYKIGICAQPMGDGGRANEEGLLLHELEVLGNRHTFEFSIANKHGLQLVRAGTIQQSELNLRYAVGVCPGGPLLGTQADPDESIWQSTIIIRSGQLCLYCHGIQVF